MRHVRWLPGRRAPDGAVTVMSKVRWFPGDSGVTSKWQRYQEEQHFEANHLKECACLRGQKDTRDRHGAHDFPLELQFSSITGKLLDFHQLAVINAANNHSARVLGTSCSVAPLAVR
jgi:hypothetical protein